MENHPLRNLVHSVSFLSVNSELFPSQEEAVTFFFLFLENMVLCNDNWDRIE